MFVKLMDKSHLKENEEAFQLIDMDHTGTISVEDCLAKVKSINQNHIFNTNIDEEDV